MIEKIRNIAIIAHVDHGKTTLVDKLFQQTGALGERADVAERVMDSNDLEKERGITILAKNTAIEWRDYHINIVDTPGHADFGGEVERVLSMVDSVLLLVDAVDGPMPQTRFVTQKAFQHGLKPIVVVNKIDRPSARPDWVIDQVFDLFDSLGASDEQLDFPVVYASAIQGIATLDYQQSGADMTPLLETVIEHAPAPQVDVEGPLQLQISSLDYSSYVGVIGIGRVMRGVLKTNQAVVIIDSDSQQRSGRIRQVLGYLGIERTPVEQAAAGDIIAISGIDNLKISDTICDKDNPEPLPVLSVDEPTITMTFQVNDSPFAGQDGDYITSRKIHERLQRELIHNVALRVEQGDSPDKFTVSGRGELHLGVLIENMRREGYELAVSRPDVVTKQVGDTIHEPYELVTIDIEEQHQGYVMETLGARGGDIKELQPDGTGRVRLVYMIPSRSLIGFHSELLIATSGTAVLNHVFDHYAVVKDIDTAGRLNGALIANGQGKAKAYALWNLQERGQLIIGPQVEVYEGMIVGLHSRDNDLVVNVGKEKQLTNIRAAGSDENILLTPPLKITLEKALTMINDDELVEITPNFIRLRKKRLKEHERKRA